MKYEDKLQQMTDEELRAEIHRTMRLANRVVSLSYILVAVAILLVIAGWSLQQ